MDSIDLLAREEEFKKLNKQLEKKTVSLMKEIENAMQKQDIFSEFSTNIFSERQNSKKHLCTTPKLSESITPEHTPVKTKNIKAKAAETKEVLPESDRSSPKNADHYSMVYCNCGLTNKELNNFDVEFFYAFLSISIQDKVLPESFLRDKASIESVCKFLASKVKLLQEQIHNVQSCLDRKNKQCEDHLTQIADYESERMKMLNTANNLRSISTDFKAKNQVLQKRLEEKDRQFKEQRSESDKMSSESKRLRSKNANLEARCVSQCEEIDRLKMQIDVLKNTEKDFRTSTRQLSASHTNAISRLEAKVKSLTSTIDKQNQLIDNLRKQIALLSADICVKGVEKELYDFLSAE